MNLTEKEIAALKAICECGDNRDDAIGEEIINHENYTSEILRYTSPEINKIITSRKMMSGLCSSLSKKKMVKLSVGLDNDEIIQITELGYKTLKGE